MPFRHITGQCNVSIGSCAIWSLACEGRLIALLSVCAQGKFPDSSLCFAMNPCVQDYMIGTTALEVDIRECRSPCLIPHRLDYRHVDPVIRSNTWTLSCDVCKSICLHNSSRGHTCAEQTRGVRHLESMDAARTGC